MRYFTVFRLNRPPLRIEFPDEQIFESDNGSRFIIAPGPVTQGHSGIVFPARRTSEDGSIDRLCALKILKRLDDISFDRFDNEIRLMQVLDHVRISGFYGSGIFTPPHPESVEVPWLAMDLGGINFRREIEHEGPLPMAEVKRLGMQLCEALAHVHAQDIIHRDLKPANLVWADPDAKNDLMMIDFGIAKYVGEDVSLRPMDQLTQHLEFVGPQFYSSPELIEYARDKAYQVDHRSDLYQLGLVLWFLATNRIIAGRPSKRQDPSGGRLLEIVNDLIAMEPDERPDTAMEVTSRLAEL